MKRAVCLYSLMFICLAANRICFVTHRIVTGQSDARSSLRPEVKKVCPFSIIGMWRSDATTESMPIYFSFSSDGWVTLQGQSANTLPHDFEMIAQVTYKLDNPAAPRQVEFSTPRGNDIFPRGITSLEITERSDNTFTTLDPVTGQKAQWVREQTERYFLAFAARSGPPAQGGPAFAIWTLMDGRKTEVEALGVQLVKDDAGKSSPVFGSIPDELLNRTIEDSDKDKKGDKDTTVFLRLELTAAEFETTHQLYQMWEKQAKTLALPNADPYLNGMEFLKRVAESLNQCGEKIKLRPLTQRERDEIVSRHTLPQFLLEYLKEMRKKNDELHINNAVFPWGWRPMIQMRGQ